MLPMKPDCDGLDVSGECMRGGIVRLNLESRRSGGRSKERLMDGVRRDEKFVGARR